MSDDDKDRLKALEDSVEGMRAQNSAEHDSMLARILHMTEIVHWIKAQWEKFKL